MLATPQYRIALNGKLDARGLCGLRKKIGTLDLAVDDPERFAAILERSSPRRLLREEGPSSTP